MESNQVSNYNCIKCKYEVEAKMIIFYLGDLKYYPKKNR